jgi:purine-binding chemotaxis protein CheW
MADGAATADPVRAEPIALDLAAFAAPASDSPERAFGLFRIGRAMVAIPVEAVREATPARPLSALPGGAPGLLGALTLRGDVIPVLDLRERLQLPHDDAAQAIIVVVRISGGRLLGFSADEVCGIARTRASEMTTLHVRDAGAEDETPHAFVAGERAVVALDVERIAAAPGTPLGQERAASSARAARAQAGSWLLFRAGDARFAVDSLQVEAALPRTTIERNALSSDYCLGVARLRDREVAVLCPQGALGVGPVCAPAAAEIVVVRLGGGALIGFAIDAVETIRRFEAADNLPLPALGGMRDGFFSGLLGPEQGEPALAIDPEALRRDPLIAGLAEVGQSRRAAEDAGRPAAEGDAIATERRQHLVFSAGGLFAAPIAEVREIAPMPQALARPPSHAPALLGLWRRRGRATALFDFAALEGRYLSEPPAHVLIVEPPDSAPVGFAIAGLVSIERAEWRSRAGAPGGAGSEPMVLLRSAGRRQTVARVDLLEMAARLGV